MKSLSPILIFLSISAAVYGDYESAISDLNADLVPIYQELLKEGRPTDLIGQRLQLSLSLKHSTDRFLLFTDTQVAINKNTKYYLVKWKFKPSDVEALLGKSNIRCKVTGRIVEVVKGATSPRMPYIIVELESIEF